MGIYRAYPLLKGSLESETARGFPSQRGPHHFPYDVTTRGISLGIISSACFVARNSSLYSDNLKIRLQRRDSWELGWGEFKKSQTSLVLCLFQVFFKGIRSHGIHHHEKRLFWEKMCFFFPSILISKSKMLVVEQPNPSDFTRMSRWKLGSMARISWLQVTYSPYALHVYKG